MQRFLVLIALLALCVGAQANTCVPLQAGATDQSVYVEFIDATTGVPNSSLAFNSSGIDLEYVRSGAAATDITEATQTAGGAHSDGGFVSVGHGRYRLDLPDAAVAAGVPQVVVQGVITGYILLPCVVALSPPANVVSFGGTAGTFSSGRAEVNTSHWGGTAVASATVNANATQISGDSTAADNLETAFDDTAGAVRWQGITDQGTAQSATGTTLVLRSAAAFADDEIIGSTIVITGGSAGVGQARTITDYVSSTDTATVSTWTTTPTGTITYKVYGTAPGSGGEGGDGSGYTAIPWNSAWDAEVQSEVADAINADTGDTFTAIPWNAAWDAQVESEVDDALGGGTGTALTSIPWNAAWDTEVQSEATDALNAYDPPTRAELTSDIAGLDTLLDTIAAYIDTEIATLLNGVNVEQINGVTITGDGSGTPFGVTP